MKSFIDFVVEAKGNSKIVDEFTNILKEASSDKLSAWFKEKGYNVDPDECQKLISQRDAIDDLLSAGQVAQY